MKNLSKFAAVILFLFATNVWAQPYGYLSRSQPAAEPAEEMPVSPKVQPDAHADVSAAALEDAMQNISEELEATLTVPDGLRGQVQQGVLPDIFNRSSRPNNPRPNSSAIARNQSPPPARRRGPGLPANARLRSGVSPSSGRTQSGSSTAVGGFVANAFQFDSNADGQLAAHEMSNLFQVLTTTMNADRTGQTLQANGTNSVNYELMQMQSVREAQSLFLQLGLSFDSNSDGQLNQNEVRTLGTCLSQNNNSLIDAALQNNPSIVPVLPQQVVPSAEPETAIQEIPQ